MMQYRFTASDCVPRYYKPGNETALSGGQSARAPGSQPACSLASPCARLAAGVLLSRLTTCPPHACLLSCLCVQPGLLLWNLDSWRPCCRASTAPSIQRRQVGGCGAVQCSVVVPGRQAGALPPAWATHPCRRQRRCQMSLFCSFLCCLQTSFMPQSSHPASLSLSGNSPAWPHCTAALGTCNSSGPA